MGIFYNNKNKVSVQKIPMVETSIDFELDTFNMLRDIEESGFNIALSHRQSMYVGLKENSVEILEESLKDFFKDAAAFFKKLAMKIIDFAKNTMKMFVSYFGDFEKFLKDNEETLRSMNPNFSFKGFNFSFPDAPVLTKVYDIAASYNMDIHRIDNMQYSDILKMKDDFAKPETKNKIRESILDTNNVTQDTFIEKSKLKFRDSKDPVTIEVNRSYVDMVLREYGNLKKLLNDTETKKNKIVKMLNDFETFFLRKASVTYDNLEKVVKTNELRSDDDTMNRGDIKTAKYSDETLKILNAYFDLKYSESRFISNCVITVYLDKVNALKDCLKQYRAVIRQCLGKKDNDVKDKQK